MVHISLKFLLEWCEFPLANSLAEKNYDSFLFDVVEIARIASHTLFQILTRRLVIRHMN